RPMTVFAQPPSSVRNAGFAQGTVAGFAPARASASLADAASFADTAAVQVRDLSFYYGKFQGLKNVSLDIARKKVTAFIGPSGCGKSTLLRTFNRMFDL